MKPCSRDEMVASIKDGSDWEDDWHSYFRVFGGSDWIDVAKEGVALLEHVMGVQTDDYSPISNAIHAVSAQSGGVAYSNVAKVLGLDGEVFETAMNHLLEIDPGAKGIDKIMESYQEVLSWKTAPLNSDAHHE
jgi:hypothetical protein